MSTMGVGAYANIAGGEMQGWAALLEKWAMADAYQAELKRQADYKQQAQDLINGRIPTAGAAEAQNELAQGVANRLAAYGKINAVPLALPTKGQPKGNPAREAATAQLLAQPRAQQGAYSDWGLQQAIKNINTQRALNQIENFAGGTSKVFPYRMYDAQHSWDDLAEIGQAISSIGGGSTNYSQYSAPPSQYSQVAYPQGVDYTPPPTVSPQGDPSTQGPMYAGYGYGGGYVTG